MIYRFAEFELDAGKFELRRQGSVVAAEPQVLALLLLLAENAERMVSKDEIVEKVWNGRIVSDAAISSRIKSARAALGDDGSAQRLIRTVHGRGFRFAAPVTPHAAPTSAAPVERAAPPAPSDTRPSIAVLPFTLLGEAGAYAAVADALPHDLIAALSRLRWLFVIARSSSFRFRGAESDLAGIGAALGARYCLSGLVEVSGGKIAVTVELADTATGGVVWGERHAEDLDGVHEIRARIVASIVAALDLRIPLAEAERARLVAPERLDAWAAYHLGLDRMLRFNRADNAAAADYFAQALAHEPQFARAHAGLSFTHFQNAFLDYTGGHAAELAAARQRAEQALACDPLDPFVNQAMARASWLEGDVDGCLAWGERALEISPNYAQGAYVHGIAEALAGDGGASARDLSLAMRLSPLDPLRYAMLASTALSHIVREEFAEAIAWAERAARLPGAHFHIDLIAAAAHLLAGDEQAGRGWAQRALLRHPGIGVGQFLRAFPFKGAVARETFARALRDAGIAG